MSGKKQTFWVTRVDVVCREQVVVARSASANPAVLRTAYQRACATLVTSSVMRAFAFGSIGTESFDAICLVFLFALIASASCTQLSAPNARSLDWHLFGLDFCDLARAFTHDNRSIYHRVVLVGRSVVAVGVVCENAHVLSVRSRELVESVGVDAENHPWH